MAIHVSKRAVLNNVVRFQDRLLEIKEMRRCAAFIHAKTGDIAFDRKKVSGADWLEIEIDVEKERVFAHAKKEEPLVVLLQPAALRVLQETIEALGHLLEEVHRHPGELPEVQVSRLHGAIESLAGWKGKIDRLRAEQMLRAKPVGSYLLRNGDDLTEAMAEQLAASNGMPLEPYLCTVVEAEEKISDILLFHTDLGWIVYEDNTHLAEYKAYNSLHDLLASLHKKAKFPI